MTQPPFPSDRPAYPEQSQATTILVLGILGVIGFCTFLGPFAWVMGNRELEAIDSGRRPPENRSTANAGRIMGMIATGFLIVGLALGLLLFGFAVFG